MATRTTKNGNNHLLSQSIWPWLSIPNESLFNIDIWSQVRASLYFNVHLRRLPSYHCFARCCRGLWYMHSYIKGELRPEISLLHMKVLTLIKAKSNVFLWYVQCCSGTRRSKTKIVTTRAPPSWFEFDVVTSHRQTRHLECGLWFLISKFLRLSISCKSQKNRLTVSSNRFK